MTILTTSIDINSSRFKEQYSEMATLVSHHSSLVKRAALGGGREAAIRHEQRGKLLPRDRIAALIDKNTEFFELSPLAAHSVYDEEVPGAGIITGLGWISGHLSVIVANDPTVKGGTYFPLTVKKHIRAQEIALENHLPCAYLVDSGGAYLPRQDEVFPDRDHFGRIFYLQARMSAFKIPQLAIVLGSCTAGGAYVPAMSDEAIMVKGNSTIFLGGPPLVRAATGENIDAESLGGAEVHCTVSGVADHFADCEQAAFDKARAIFARYPGVNSDKCYRYNFAKTPRYNPEEIYGIVPRDLRKQYDVREILARIVDDSYFDEFKARYARTIVCGFAEIGGHLIGILANNGILFSESALKGAHFIQLCSQRDIPLLFLQNIVGFMVGSKAEHEGIAKHGAKLVANVATTHVPKVTVLIGGSFGAGNYAMCGRAYNPRFLFSWPNSRISVMGGEQAARVMSIIHAEKHHRNGQLWTDDDEVSLTDPIRAQYEIQGNPFYATARLWDDGILDPAKTRDHIIQAFNATQFAPLEKPLSSVLRM
jgi:3-methylcrotonyl-CoA carboxylase beta subunit